MARKENSQKSSADKTSADRKPAQSNKVQQHGSIKHFSRIGDKKSNQVPLTFQGTGPDKPRNADARKK